MSSSISTYLTYISQQASIYYGIPVLIAGILGGFINTIVFLSLHTFRESSCGFYLTIMSIANIGQLVSGLLSRIMITGYADDWTETSPFCCKLRPFLLQLCTLTSLSCICLTTIDQYFETCSYPRLQQWSNLKMAHRLTSIFFILWNLHGIPFLIYYNQVQSLTTGKISCAIVDATFANYYGYVYSLILSGILPICVTILFALMAFRNVRQLTYRTVPLIRRELEKQLTIMVLVQVAVNSIILSPSSIVSAMQLNITLLSNSDIAAIIQFASVICVLFRYLNFANPFYIYICVSDRFRRQLIYVLSEMHPFRWRRPRMVVNQIAPTL